MPKIAASGFTILLLASLLQSCCEPRQRNSQPLVIDSLYSDSAVKDQVSPLFGQPGDSGYYPIYSLGVKNVGAEADTFTVRFLRLGYYFELKDFVQPGQISIFRSPGPLKDTASPNAQLYYYSFFVTTPDSVAISKMRPDVTIQFGGIYNGPEGCNSDPETQAVDIDALK